MMAYYFLIGLFLLVLPAGFWALFNQRKQNQVREKHLIQGQVDQHRELLSLQHEIRSWKYDELTTLLSEYAFFKELESAELRGTNTQWALIVIDLDDFNALSGSLTAEEQDRILKFAADRISSVVRQVDVLAKAHRDVFWLWLRHVNQKESVGLVAERILSACSIDLIRIRDYCVQLSMSMGIAVSVSSGDQPVSVHDMRNHALSALMMAKHSGKHQYAFFNQEVITFHHEFMAVSHALSPLEIERALSISYVSFFTVQADEVPCVMMHIKLQETLSETITEISIVERAWETGKLELLLGVCLLDWQRVHNEFKDHVCLIPALAVSLQNPHFALHFMQICKRMGVDTHRIGFTLLPHRLHEIDIKAFQKSVEQLRYLGVFIATDFFSAVGSTAGIHRYLNAVFLEKSMTFFEPVNDLSALMLVFKPILELCFAMNIGIVLDQKLHQVYLKLNWKEAEPAREV